MSSSDRGDRPVLHLLVLFRLRCCPLSEEVTILAGNYNASLKSTLLSPCPTCALADDFTISFTWSYRT